MDVRLAGREVRVSEEQPWNAESPREVMLSMLIDTSDVHW
jgi:hypothetical protein